MATGLRACPAVPLPSVKCTLSQGKSKVPAAAMPPCQRLGAFNRAALWPLDKQGGHRSLHAASNKFHVARITTAKVPGMSVVTPPGDLASKGKWAHESQLPPKLLSDVPGTWAHDTMSRRIREDILVRVYSENTEYLEAHPKAKKELDALNDYLKRAAEVKLRELPLLDDGGPDYATWQSLLQPYLDKTWLTAPWVVTEFYLYRKLAQIFNWFSGEHYDPFEDQKELGLTTAVAEMEELAHRLDKTIRAALTGPVRAAEDGFKLLCYAALWGNKVDLSLWPVSESGESNVARALEAGHSKLLVDDLELLWEKVGAALVETKSNDRRIDIVVDNAGFELFTDLCLADYVVASGMAQTVVLQVKGHPTFVSDALAKDVDWMIQTLSGLGKEFHHVASVAKRWKSYLETGQWKLRPDYFWCQPGAFWEMPAHIVADLTKSNLTIVKGDANYRRLLGDRDWPYDTPFDEVCGYFPSPLCALRALKAELACGIPKGVAARTAKVDPKWLVDGQWGVVQFTDKGVLK